MHRKIALVSSLVAAVALGPALQAQQFKVDKADIGGTTGTDYVTADPATGRVYVSRQTSFQIVDGASMKVVGEIPDSRGNHGVAIAPKHHHGFTTNSADSTSTMFDTQTGAVIKKVHLGLDRADGIMYDDFSDQILTIHHAANGLKGGMIVIDPDKGEVVGKVELSDDGPEGGVSDGKGRIFVNEEGSSSIDVVDAKTWKMVDNWKIAPCEGPTGIAMDRKSNRIFSGCPTTSVVTDASTGKVVAQISNAGRVDALGYDDSQKLIYIPAGAGEGSVTIVHEDGPDKYTTVATVTTFPGAKTIAVDDKTHTAYLFQPERGPAPAPTNPPPAGGRGRGPAGPVIHGWFIKITH